MDRFSDFKLGIASYLKRERAGVARAASSCNVFAIATFSSYMYTLLYKLLFVLSSDICYGYSGFSFEFFYAHRFLYCR